MNNNYEPDNQFLDRLEWQLASEYRRVGRSKLSSGKITVSRRMVAITLVTGALMTGVAVTKAAEYIKDSWRKKIEIARAETEVELKKVYLESTREMVSSVKTQVSKGSIPPEEYTAMKFQAEKAELDLKNSLINLDEVKASGLIPRNELYAPVVKDRDFVSERLILERKGVELDLQLLRNHREQIERMVQANLVEEEVSEQMQTEFAAQKEMIEKIQRQLDLRKRYVAGEITAREVEIQDRITIAERTLKLAQVRVKFMKKQLERSRSREAKGMIPPMEIKQLQYQLNAAQTELKLAALEMDVLKKVK